MRNTAPLLYTTDAAKHDTAHCEEASPSWHPLGKKKERIDQSGEATVMTLPSSDWSGGCQEGAKGSHSALGFTPIKSKHHYQRHRKFNNKTNSTKLACLNCSHFWVAYLASAVMEGGDLDYLLKNNFTKLPQQQRIKIKSDGRPTPKLKLRVERKQGFFRTFNEENYTRTEWLAGSSKPQRLFCWPCLLFDKDSCSLNNPWVTTGFVDLANLSRAIKRHGKSKSHMLFIISNTVIVWVVLHVNMKLEIADSRAVDSLTISGLCISVGEGLHL